MRGMWAIFKKDVKGFLTNPNFLLVCALTTTILSWIFPNALKMFELQQRTSMFSGGFNNQMSNIHYGLFFRHLSSLNLVLIFVVPALTMRLFAEERKLKTFDLLLTSPVTSVQIVLGKWFAAMVAVLTIMVLSFIYPASMRFFAEFSWTTLLMAYLGIFFVAAIYASMDLFCSSLTESAIVAYVMAVILNMFIWFVGMGAENLDTAWLRSVVEHISINQHLSGLVEGTVRTTGLVYFITLIVFFGFLCERVVESARWR